jgi:carboxyl-terminal processing protease
MPPTRRVAALALAATLAAGCAAFDPYNLLSRQPPARGAPADVPVPAPAHAGLGHAGRLAALDFVWRTVNERYYDPKLNGVDWRAARSRWEPLALAAGSDEEFWDLLDRMAGEMRDAHTRVESPERAAQIERHEFISPGFTFAPVEGRLVVTRVDRESDAWWAGVRPGMTLSGIGGEPAQAAYDRALARSRESSTPLARHRGAVRRLIGRDEGRRVDLAFTRTDGSALAVSLERKRVASPPRVTHRTLPSGIGYIRLTAWSQGLQGRMIAAVEALKDAPGLVIDLRDNPGGSGLMVRNVAARLFPEGEKVEFGRTLTRTGKPITIAFDWIEIIKVRQELEGTGTYAGPVAVLVNAGSGSGSELFAAALQSRSRATIVGQTTCGCLLGYLGYAEIPGGGKLAYSEMGFEFPDGRRIEREGVVPDVAIAPSVADLAVERDRALEAAEAAVGMPQRLSVFSTSGVAIAAPIALPQAR